MTLLQSFRSTDYMKWKVSKTLTSMHSCYASQIQPSTIILCTCSIVPTELKPHRTSTIFQHPYFGQSSDPFPTYRQPATQCEPTAQSYLTKIISQAFKGNMKHLKPTLIMLTFTKDAVSMCPPHCKLYTLDDQKNPSIEVCKQTSWR